MSRYDDEQFGKTATVSLIAFFTCFVGLTLYDAFIEKTPEQGGQPESGVVQITTSPCPDATPGDTIAQLKDKLLTCRAALQDLTDQVHNEFDQEE